MLTVRISEGVGDDALLDYATLDPSSLIYGTPRFMGLVAGHLQDQPGWLVASRGETIVGALPYHRMDGPLGPVFNSLAYFGSNGGVIQAIPDDEAKVALVEGFYGLAEEHGAATATIITNPLLADSEFYAIHSRFDFRDERIGQITHLPSTADEEAILKSFDDPRPRNIRRAIREGVEIERARSPKALKFLYDTHFTNMSTIGGLAKRREFFDAIPEAMKDRDWSIYVARLRGEPVAALLLFYFNQTVEYFTPAIVRAHRSTQALPLAIFVAMKDAIRAGYRNWNWGGTWLRQDGVYDFKKRWGTSEYPYFYYTRLFRSDLLQRSKTELLEHYPGFFVIPFAALEPLT